MEKTVQMNIRMLPEKWRLVKNASELRGEDVSDFVRRAVYTELARLSYLSEKEKKALGVS